MKAKINIVQRNIEGEVEEYPEVALVKLNNYREEGQVSPPVAKSPTKQDTKTDLQPVPAA